MSKSVTLSCKCGGVKGHLKIAPGSYFHVHCLCCDCQSFAEKLNNTAHILDEHGGSELFQTYPAYMEITEGHDNIRCMQLKRKGLYRWYTACCNMPLANTMGKANVPFVGISVKLMHFASEQEKLETLGPVTLKAFGKYAIGDAPKDVHPTFPISYMPKILLFMLKGKLLKKYTPHPFFKDNAPIVKRELMA